MSRVFDVIGRAEGVAHITASSDAEAVGLWLAEYRESPQTFKAYRREAERLLLWLSDTRRRLGELDREGLREFEAFLEDPQPASRWVGSGAPRSSPAWRPFRAGLSPASRRQSLVILQGLYGWLVEAGWVAHNPFRLMRDKSRRLNNQTLGVERYLEYELWQWLWGWLNGDTEEGASTRQRYERARCRFIFSFAYLLAPRISEMASARMEDFVFREGRWWWVVTGKGQKTARIPLPEDMLGALAEWRLALGLSSLPAFDEATPLLRALDGVRGISDNQLYRLIKKTFAQAAEALEAEQGAPGHIEALRHATPHWLRHTSITHQAQSGIELRYLAQSARHARLETTSRYLHTEAEQWHTEQQRHRLGASPTKRRD
ncbi:tyrosine-type recombinase/integrase [Halomonas sp. PAMB 3232]|uniref:tyrosine-type recombinase/integrase n=1 Tax=Halomonas sp. PAMB 3232 TaxID=3075221 RepID=UPI00289B0AA0|nr:tyrosine-type recombinase/integrase [Halomonas sp. PAMB 3232]WNL40608.1 tyrosine-type recombinase/integrase [Halomonas sp. PAMB 3232]